MKRRLLQAGAVDAVISTHWEDGGAGAADLATAVMHAADNSNPDDFRFLYVDTDTMRF